MSRATAVGRTGVGLVISAGDIISPIQAVFRPNQNVVDHVETGSDRVLPPAQAGVGVIITSGVIDLIQIVTTEVFTTAGERESVVKLILRIGRSTIPGGIILPVYIRICSIRTSGVAEDGVEGK